MTTIAHKVFSSNDHDNMVLTRLVSESKEQEHMPARIDRDYEDRTAYVFADGSALISKQFNDWLVVDNYAVWLVLA